VAVPSESLLDEVLVMTVHPGFGGQAFVPEHLGKVRRAAAIRDARGFAFRIQVDGGIKVDTAAAAVGAGADVLVSGSGIFGQPDPAAAARAIRAVACA
jgi:ribulose-phosphate 3-epimerase